MLGLCPCSKKGDIVTAEILKDRGILSKIEPYGLKVLGNGELNVALTVKAAVFTAGAKEKIKKAGGVSEVIEVVNHKIGPDGKPLSREERS